MSIKNSQLNSIGKRIREARKKNGLTQDKLAKLASISKKSLENYEKDTTDPTGKVILDIAKLCYFDPAWLLTGHHPESASNSDKSGQTLIDRSYPLSHNPVSTNQNTEDSMRNLKRVEGAPIPIEQGQIGRRDGYVYVPRYNVQASAGYRSIVHSEQIVSYLAFEETWIRQELGLDPAHILLIKSVGDSMMPTFGAGALLLVNTAVQSVKNDSIYVMNRDGELIVKRIQDLMNGQVKIKSDNPSYEPLVIQKTDALKIVGGVVWIGQKN